jgi:hypothetical protein
MTRHNLPVLPPIRLPANAIIAYNQISGHYIRGHELLSQEEPDTIRLKVLADTLLDQCLPTLVNISRIPGIDANWSEQAKNLFVGLEHSLRSSIDAIQGSDSKR